MSRLLETRGLRHEFSNRTSGTIAPLQGIDLTVDAGEFVAVVGPSGTGKTTLLLACGGLRRPTAGTVEIAGTRLYDLPARRRAAFRAANIGFVFQTMALIPYLSLWENLMMVPYARIEQADHWVGRLGLEDRRHHSPGQLSQGERQRAALARALVHRPKLILADEPTGNLDQDNSQKVFEALTQFAEEGGAVLIATHDLAMVSTGQCTRQLRLESGELAAS